MLTRFLVHCGKKIKITAIYSISNFEHYSQLFLFLGDDCPHCNKKVMGQAGLDIWGKPMLYQADGTAILPSDEKQMKGINISPRDVNNTEDSTEIVGKQFGMTNKKLTAKYLQLIQNGDARQIEKSPTQYTHRKAGMVGMSEYSSRTASRQGIAYTLHLENLLQRYSN